jgi:hypothetical protein
VGVNFVVLCPSKTSFLALRAAMSRHRMKVKSIIDHELSTTVKLLGEFYALPLYIQVRERMPSVNNFDHKIALVDRVALKHIQNMTQEKRRINAPS